MDTYIDDSAVKRVNKLCEKYKETYGKEVDYTIIPRGITLEKMEKCLELMINENLSLVVVYTKLYSK